MRAQGRASEVVYLDAQGAEHAQKAKAVILAANGAETPRLLLLSESSRHPDGLANGSGVVGKYLMGNGHAVVHALFPEPLNEWKSIQVTRLVHDYYESDPARGFYGGGGIDARPLLNATPIMHGLFSMPEDGPHWGAEYKQRMARAFNHHMGLLSSTTSVPLASNSITLDPELKDDHGRPAVRLTYRDHPDDMAIKQFLQDRTVEIAEAAGASEVWREPVLTESVLAHLLGTCRMGDDPSSSVVDRFHRAHEVPNLFICDGSSFVSSGRGQPTMTIQALAFRAADHIAEFARRGEI